MLRRRFLNLSSWAGPTRMVGCTVFEFCEAPRQPHGAFYPPFTTSSVSLDGGRMWRRGYAGLPSTNQATQNIYEPDPTQFTTPCLFSTPCSHVWNTSYVGAHSPVPSSLRVMREVRPVSDPDKGPERVELPRRSSAFRLERLPSSAGIVPLNWLKPRSRVCRLDRLPSSVGIGPLNWLSSRFRYCRCEKLASSVGISPLNWLPPRIRRCRLDRLPSSVGIGPLNWLSSRFRYCRCEKLASSVGISPLNWLPPRIRCCRLDRLPSSAGIGPLN